MGGRGGSSGINSLLNTISGINSNPIPKVSAEEESKALKYWSKQSWSTKQNAPVEDVSMSNVRVWQDYIRQDTLRDIATKNPQYKSSTDLPMGLRMKNGDVIIMDGNHRAAVNYLKGNKKLKMRVVNYKGK